MSCFNPTFIQKSINKYTGEVSTKFISSDLAKNILECRESLVDSYTGNMTSNFVARSFDDRKYHDFIRIPCGKCIGCRMDYSRSWADRLTYHSMDPNVKNDSSWFITLTYDDEHMDGLQYSLNYDLYALNYDHVTEFIKKLRNKYRDEDIDYFYSGEYGDLNMRCHFHMIIFNLPLTDLEYWKCNKNGDPIYISETISSLWHKGFCTISPFNWRSAAYTARYVEKKLDGRRLNEYTAVGLTPEKARCSRRPGIAHQYYLDHCDELWDNNGLNVSRDVNATGHLGLPRYFRKLAVDKGIGIHAFQRYQKRCLDRQNILNEFELKQSSFDLDSIHDMLKFEEREILSKKSIRDL